MTVAIRSLLRLPPCLRSRLLSCEPMVQSRLDTLRHSPKTLQTRGFHLTPANQVAKPSKPPPRPQQHHNRPSQLPFGRTPSGRTSNANVPPPIIREPTINKIEPELDKVLLYVSPDHGAFYISSYLVGACLLLGAVLYAQLTLKDEEGKPKTHWMVKFIGGFSVLFTVIIGTRVLLAPTNLVKAITIIQTPNATAGAPPVRKLQFQMKRNLPFLKPDILETDPSKVTFDRRLPVSTGQLNCFSVPSTEAKSFTEAYFSGNFSNKPPGSNVFSRFNQGLLNLWPAIKRETTRMTLRDQIAHVQIEPNGIFKVDLRDAMLLDGGRPLDRLVNAGDIVPGMVGYILKIYNHVFK